MFFEAVFGVFGVFEVIFGVFEVVFGDQEVGSICVLL